jgi:hypothetical protein
VDAVIVAVFRKFVTRKPDWETEEEEERLKFYLARSVRNACYKFIYRRRRLVAIDPAAPGGTTALNRL